MVVRMLCFVLIVLMGLTACTGKSKEELLAEGIKQLQGGDSGSAAVIFKSILEKDENYIEARFQLAKAYIKMGRKEHAEKELLKVFRQNPARDDVTLELARVYNSMGKADEAFMLGEQYLVRHPGSADGFEVLGLASAVNKKYGDAERYLQSALNAAPTRDDVKIELAVVYHSSGDAIKAKKYLEDIIVANSKNIRAYYLLASLEKDDGNFDAALRIYKKIQAVNKDETLASYKAGMLLIEMGSVDDAHIVATELLKNYPKSAESQRLKGLLLYHKKNYGEALTYLQNAQKILPTLEGHHFLGLCYYNRGELENALSQFRIVIDNLPAARQARLMSAIVLLTQKRTDDAIAEINKLIKEDENDAVAHNLLGNAYMSKGMFDEGLQEFNRAIKLDPKMVDSYIKRGVYFLSKGKNQEGETELASAVHAGPGVVTSRLMLASYYMRYGNWDKAIATIKSGVSGNISDAVLYNALASILFASGKQDEAVKNLQRAKSIDPLLPGTYQNLAVYYATMGQYDKALAEYHELLKHNPHDVTALLGVASLYDVKGDDRNAIASFNTARGTKQPIAFSALAKYYLKKGEEKKALAVLDDALKASPRDLSLLEQKGQVLIVNKKLKDAIKVYDEIELIQPDAGTILKISAYSQMRETGKALDLAKRQVEKYPRSARGYILLAKIHESNKDYTTALNELTKGLKIDPTNAEALVYIGSIYEKRAELEKAMNYYSEALAKHPENVTARFAQGALLDKTGKKKEAIAIYREVVEKTGTYLPALNNLAYLYADGYGAKEDALRLAIRAYKQDTGNPGIMDTLGYALLKNGRTADAQKVLSKAVSLLPQNPSVLYHLALVNSALGDRRTTEELLQKALGMPDFPEASIAKSLLAQVKQR